MCCIYFTIYSSITKYIQQTTTQGTVTINTAKQLIDAHTDIANISKLLTDSLQNVNYNELQSRMVNNTAASAD